ncbi:transcriptional repressor [Methylobacterium pseudosasicola]|uniref:Fur family transcriptional regulator, zinc uptake regulator n=1 Tax=Methylobacterium pseudosasicola TaxID=582667 RepID=A0A1I4PC18_9HYPH|nr:transcriptional repressor [Methylobacterium pseudosasicola]SFM25358.1 Fur family transcriptional regulator, zinc uptake regulator [Methylobacterium pseudosasicola]
MHRHESHDACHTGVGDMLARAEAVCRERGLQFTPLRREVMEAVAEAGKAQGAYDIAEKLSAPGKRVAPVSVYRALDFLMQQGLVHRIASRNAFIPCAHGHAPGEGVVFLICRTCGLVDEASSEELEDGLDRTLKRAGFTPAHTILEVEGDCGACRERQQPS